MAKNYMSYLRAFRMFAFLELKEANGFIEIGTYANLLTEKANKLLNCASSNDSVNLITLQKQMFEAGGRYIRKFTTKFSANKIGDHVPEVDYYTEKQQQLTEI